GSATVTVVVTTTAAAPASLVSSPTIAGNETDPNTANNAPTITATIAPLADVGIAQTGPPTVGIGGSATFTLTATNSGPSLATGVTVDDTLPASLGYVSAIPTQGSCSQASGTVHCSLGSLAPGASATVVLVTSASAF